MRQVEAALRPQFEAFFAENASPPDAVGNTPHLEVASGANGVDGLRTRYAETLAVLFAMVALILLVACASIASLLLARAAARRREMAIHMSLGVGRFGVVRQSRRRELWQWSIRASRLRSSLGRIPSANRSP
ncbi:MAG TPA: hypothetical protein VIN61_12230 [Gammaproteobacteria bacterium]